MVSAQKVRAAKGDGRGCEEPSCGVVDEPPGQREVQGQADRFHEGNALDAVSFQARSGSPSRALL